jgi:DNA-binding protein HU-beta
MNKSELIDTVSKQAKLTKASTAKAVDAVFDTISKSLKKKTEVRIIGFGTFTTSKRSARQGRNPRTGANIKIPASTVPKFRPGKELKEAVNK